jgi:hypothetical protein
VAIDSRGYEWIHQRAQPYSLVILGVAAALIVLFTGAAVILAVGHTVPTEYWAAASGLSGALVGILAPSPKERAKDAAARRAGHAAAAKAAAEQPPHVADTTQATLLLVETAPTVLLLRSEAERASKEAEGAAEQYQEEHAHARHTVLKAAADAVDRAQDVAASAKEWEFKMLLALAVLIAALALGIVFTLELGEHPGKAITVRDTALKDLSGALIALATAAGGALVGFTAPAPSQHDARASDRNPSGQGTAASGGARQ